jgi:hypothetical protein
MPILYKIEPALQRVFTNVSGTVSVLEIIGHFEIARREGFLTYSEFIDTSNIQYPSLSIGDIGKAALTVRKINHKEKFGARAVLVANETIFNLTRIFATLMAGYIPMKVFLDRIKAEEWLNNETAAQKRLA